jgi:hypothetical protein
MRTLGRFCLGFVIGFVLLVWATILAGAGHGTAVPLITIMPLPISVLDPIARMGMIGFWLIQVPGNGLLWAAYFSWLPKINSLVVRMVAVTLIGCIHFGAASWALSWDTEFARTVDRLPLLTIGFFAFLLVVLVGLGARTWAGPHFRWREAASVD